MDFQIPKEFVSRGEEGREYGRGGGDTLDLADHLSGQQLNAGYQIKDDVHQISRTDEFGTNDEFMVVAQRQEMILPSISSSTLLHPASSSLQQSSSLLTSMEVSEPITTDEFFPHSNESLENIKVPVLNQYH